MVQIFENIFKWAFDLIMGIENIAIFLFKPMSESIAEIDNLPNWVINTLQVVISIFGDVAPIVLIGISGVIIGVVIAILKAFI